VVICTPNFTPFVAIAFLAALYFRSDLTYPVKKESVYRMAGIVVTGALVGLLFLEMIHFKLGLFWTTFSDFSKGAPARWFSEFLKEKTHIVLRVFALIALATAGVYTAVRRPQLFDVRVTWEMALALAVGLVSVMVLFFSSVNGNLWLDTYLAFVILWLVLHFKGTNLPVCVVAVLVLAMLAFHHRYKTEQMATLLYLRPKISQPEFKAQIEAMHADQVYVDPFALAAIYDYRLPPRTYDFFFGFEGIPFSMKDMPPNSLLVLSPVYMENETVPASTALFGRHDINMFRDPYKFVLLRTPARNP
jgi:hypothetical protein